MLRSSLPPHPAARLGDDLGLRHAQAVQERPGGVQVVHAVAVRQVHKVHLELGPAAGGGGLHGSCDDVPRRVQHSEERCHRAPGPPFCVHMHGPEVGVASRRPFQGTPEWAAQLRRGMPCGPASPTLPSPQRLDAVHIKLRQQGQPKVAPELLVLGVAHLQRANTTACSHVACLATRSRLW